MKNEIESIEKKILADKYITAMKKVRFIDEIKNGLGDEIKVNGGSVKIIKKTKYERFIIWLKKIFTKF